MPVLCAGLECELQCCRSDRIHRLHRPFSDPFNVPPPPDRRIPTGQDVVDVGSRQKSLLDGDRYARIKFESSASADDGLICIYSGSLQRRRVSMALTGVIDDDRILLRFSFRTLLSHRQVPVDGTLQKDRRGIRRSF